MRVSTRVEPRRRRLTKQGVGYQHYIISGTMINVGESAVINECALVRASSRIAGVIGFHVSQETRVQMRIDDVAGNICGYQGK